MDVTLYHNPRCSKSRQTLDLLQQQGIEPTIILYLHHPFELSTLKTLYRQLGFDDVRLMMRPKDALKVGIDISDTTLSDEFLLNALVSNPSLFERPVVVANDKAMIGRPPEQVLSLFNKSQAIT